MPDKHSSLKSHTYHSGHEHAFKSPLNGCPSLLRTEPLSRKLNPIWGAARGPDKSAQSGEDLDNASFDFSPPSLPTTSKSVLFARRHPS